MSDTKPCPLCGEQIKATAKKCRFCGEWLTEESVPVPYAEKIETLESVPLEVPVSSSANAPANYNFDPITGQPLQVPTIAQGNPPANFDPVTGQPLMPGVNPGSQTIMTAGGQPIILNVNQNVQQQQSVEQTVVVNGGSSDSSSGWLFTEMFVISAGLGIYLKSWWWFLGILLIGSCLLMMPYIGAVMCVILGLGWGLIAAAIGSIWGTAAAWVLGILVGLGAIYGHLEARKSEMDD